MMKVTIEREGTRTRLRVEGKISGPWVDELRRCWESLPVESPEHPIAIELADVSYIDDAGKVLITQMVQAGAEIWAQGCSTAAIVKSIRPGAQRERSGAPAKPSGRGGRGRRLFLVPFLFFLAVSTSRAQATAGKPPLQLNLHQAVQIALKQNPSVQIAALNLTESQKESGIARAALLPQADFNVSDRAIRANIRAGIGLAIPGVPEAVGPFQVFQTGTDFSAPVFDLSLWRRWQASRKNVLSTSAQRQSTREQIVLLVVSQYLACLHAGAQVQAAQSQVDLAQALYNQTSDMEKNGVATGVDALRANVELQNEKQGLIVAQTNRKIALYGLSKLLNLDPRQKIALEDQTSFFQTPEISADESLAEAYQTRPEMQSLLAEKQSLEYQKRADSESRWPALTFSGDYEQQGLSSNTVIPTYVYEAGVTMPLFTGGRIHNEISRDSLEVRKIQQSILNERSQIALDVQTAVAELDSARNQVKVANLGVDLANQEVEQSRDRFKAGVADNIEVVAAQDALARANENQISALYEYNQSRADLAHAIGRTELLYNK
ncbi:MAG TPA: TolC family protein [Candidatus Limnocylindrales bacterium]|nr:TolC family protein [Candidatus Limnocylindrales bacterium]